MTSLKKLFEFFNDNIYQEDEDSTVTHNKKTYSLNILFKLTANTPSSECLVDNMKWILKYTTIDPVRKKNADLLAPLLVTETDDGIVVLDGAHRLAKAVAEKVDVLPCVFIDSALLVLAAQVSTNK